MAGLESIAPRDAYCEELIRLAQQDERIVAVEADVMGSMGTRAFAKAFPDRSINCGIQEANAVCVAAALSLEGFLPFFHAFGVFATRRAFDQVILSCAYAGAEVKIVGGDAGLSAAANGGTHMALEDMALMCAVPGMTVLDPADATAARAMVSLMANTPGNVYMRCCRRPVRKVYEPGAVFQVGKANLLREGTDVTLAACGIEVAHAVLAAELLQNQGISARVVDFFCVKPIDEEMLIRCARETGAVVFCENHNAIGGLGTMGCAVLSETVPVPCWRVGMRECFGQVGQTDELVERFGMDAAAIAQAAVQTIARKRST